MHETLAEALKVLCKNIHILFRCTFSPWVIGPSAAGIALSWLWAHSF
jgi:hypothetical protein